MDWRPTSRSRSRVADAPMSFEQHGLFPSQSLENHYPFPTLATSPLEPSKPDNAYGRGLTKSSGSIPIPGTSLLSSGRPSPPYASSNPLSSVLEDPADQAPGSFNVSADSRYVHSMHFHALSSFDDSFAPSSLPATGLHGFPKMPSGTSPPEMRSFPRHVRKTSFDHTVSREGILQNIGGRHQVNGRPLPPIQSLVGTKRPAENVHFDSLLRGDPSNMDGGTVQSTSSNTGTTEQLDSSTSFPSSSFNFSYPAYEGIFDLPASPTTSSVANTDFSLSLRASGGGVSNSSVANAGSGSGGGTRTGASGGTSQGYLSRGSMSGNLFHHQSATIGPSTHHEGLSAAAAAASAVMAEGYAQLSAANMVDGSGLDYRQLMGLGLVYPGDGSPYTHVDPTQIVNFVANVSPGGLSPTSDGWTNGLGTSATASPESYNASNASTPPPAESPGTSGVSGSGSMSQPQTSRRGTDQTRKYMSLQQGAQEVQRRKSTSASNNAINSPGGVTADAASSTSTPESAGTTAAGASANQKEESNGGSGSNAVRSGKNGEDGDQPPTLCTNCQTTNTPLWRRDPEGQPLCEEHVAILVDYVSLNMLLTGNACGLFYVSNQVSSVSVLYS